MALGPNQRAALARADSKELYKQFRKVVQQWPKKRWLSTANRYAVDTTRKLDADAQPGASVGHTQLSRYIAASALVHCVDGWSYAARALQAVVSGDAHAATHLGYYAELRAAMSILAAAGIGVFDKRHFVLASDRKCHLVHGRTHQFAWDALNQWATHPSAGDLVLDVIQPGGVSLDGWLRNFPATSGAALRGKVASTWLLDWGLDLKVFVEDREARNQASYRPTAIPNAIHPDFSRSLEFLEGFWASFEPTALHHFRVLDRYLLRRSMVQAFVATTGSSPRRAPRSYKKFLHSVLHAVTPSDLTTDEWAQFLDTTNGNNAELPIIEAAARQAKPGSANHHVEVIARAAMLLRVATGASKAFLAQLSLAERVSLGFWWQPFGEGRGFWQTGTTPSNLVDLWADVENAISNSRSWRASSGSKQGFFGSHPGSARTLSECERIPMWGLGL